MKTREFTTRMKAELNNENNLFNEFELKLYGVQAYGVTYGEEYNVIVKAARRANGRYYFITREGYEIAWFTLPTSQVEQICADMFDQHDRDELATIQQVNQLRNEGTALVPAEIMNDVADTAEAVGVRCFILTSGTDEAGRVKYLCSIGTTAEEGRELATAAKLNREAIAAENENTTTDETPAAPAAAKVARATVAKVATAAALLLLTFATSPAADELTTYHTTSTADALAVLSQLTAEGLPLYHVTIKTA